MEDAQNFVPEDDAEEDFQLEEELVLETFQTAISAARDLADQLLAFKSILSGLSDFTLDLTALQESLSENPESNQSTSLQELKTSYSALREEWKRANLPKEHFVKSELDSCKKSLTTLGAEVASALAKSDSHSIASSSSSSSERICCGNSKSDLPTIDVPTFHGSILEWSTFWASFQATIDNRKELSNTQKLHYLRKAVKDPDIQVLLHSPTESTDMYVDVVKELKERFNKTREIHRHLAKSLIQLSSPKHTRVDLRRMVDSVKRTMDSMKATKFYDLDSFLSSLVYLILPQRLQTLWDQHSKRIKGSPNPSASNFHTGACRNTPFYCPSLCSFL